MPFFHPTDEGRKKRKAWTVGWERCVGGGCSANSELEVPQTSFPLGREIWLSNMSSQKKVAGSAARWHGKEGRASRWRGFSEAIERRPVSSEHHHISVKMQYAGSLGYCVREVSRAAQCECHAHTHTRAHPSLVSLPKAGDD